MQVTTDQFILVHTVYHFYHFLLAHCDFILWPKRNHLVDLYVCNASHYYSSLAQTIHNNYQILLAYCDSIVWPILTFQVRNYPLMHIDGTTAWYICWPSTSPSFCCYTGHDYYYYMSITSISATLSDCELSASSTIAQSVSSIQTPQQRLTIKQRFSAWHRANMRGLRRFFTGCVRPTTIQWHFEHHKDWILFLYNIFSDVYILVHCDVNNRYIMWR